MRRERDEPLLVEHAELLHGALQLLGRSVDQAREAVQQFRTLDEQRLVALAPHRKDVQKLIDFSRKERENLNQLLTNEASGAPATTAGED